MNTPELEVGCYRPTKRFMTIDEHVAVKFAETDGLVALVGPAGDLESWEYARLFAAAPEMLKVLENLIFCWEGDGDGTPDDATIDRYLAEASEVCRKAKATW